MDKICFLFVAAFVCCGYCALTEEKYTKFEYEYKVLERIVELERDHKEMKGLSVKVQRLQDVNHETAKIVESQTETLKKQERYIKELERTLNSGSSASTYTRWGRRDCPANGTELVYDGYTGGSYYSHKGGASNYVCLTTQPLWGHVQSGRQSNGFIYGTEYEFSRHRAYGTDYFGKNLVNYEAPCAVCRTTRPTVIMIPGRNKCFDGWTLEYHGYLAADDNGYIPTEYTCIDISPTTVSHENGNENGALFYLVEAVCGSLKCPPYVDGAELTCVVCSK